MKQLHLLSLTLFCTMQCLMVHAQSEFPYDLSLETKSYELPNTYTEKEIVDVTFLDDDRILVWYKDESDRIALFSPENGREALELLRMHWESFPYAVLMFHESEGTVYGITSEVIEDNLSQLQARKLDLKTLKLGEVERVLATVAEVSYKSAGSSPHEYVKSQSFGRKVYYGGGIGIPIGGSRPGAGKVGAEGMRIVPSPDRSFIMGYAIEQTADGASILRTVMFDNALNSVWEQSHVLQPSPLLKLDGITVTNNGQAFVTYGCYPKKSYPGDEFRLKQHEVYALRITGEGVSEISLSNEATIPSMLRFNELENGKTIFTGLASTKNSKGDGETFDGFVIYQVDWSLRTATPSVGLYSKDFLEAGNGVSNKSMVKTTKTGGGYKRIVRKPTVVTKDGHVLVFAECINKANASGGVYLFAYEVTYGVFAPDGTFEGTYVLPKRQKFLTPYERRAGAMISKYGDGVVVMFNDVERNEFHSDMTCDDVISVTYSPLNTPSNRTLKTIYISENGKDISYANAELHEGKMISTGTRALINGDWILFRVANKSFIQSTYKFSAR